MPRQNISRAKKGITRLHRVQHDEHRRDGFKRITRAQIRAVVRKIVQEFNPERVILFGSYAYGKPTLDSDVDLLVVMKSDERPAARATRVIHALHGIKTFPMDVLVRTPEEVQHRLAIGDFFFNEIVSMGSVLYER